MKYTYKKTGVNIDAATEALRKSKKYIKATFNKNTATDVGSFGGVYKFDKNRFLVASTDGVGTKIKIAQKTDIHHTVGQDIVNHCVNDILVMGAKPLMFLDYIGMGKLSPNVIAGIIKGLSKACVENKTVLIGGETAEMPGVYKPGEYDIAGTIIGEVRKGCVITGKRIKKGDVVIGLGSSGLHTNGYSLARKVFESRRIKYTSKPKGLKEKLGKTLLKPHKSYFRSVYPLLKNNYKAVHAMAHITGGGFYDNIARILPKGVNCVINKKAWKPLSIFKLIQEKGKVDDKEMYRVFNMGIGLVMVVDKKKANNIIKFLKKKKQKAIKIGEITKGNKKVIVGNGL